MWTLFDQSYTNSLLFKWKEECIGATLTLSLVCICVSGQAEPNHSSMKMLNPWQEFYSYRVQADVETISASSGYLLNILQNESYLGITALVEAF